MIICSINGTSAALQSLPPDAERRALTFYTEDRETGCWVSMYRAGTPGGPQLHWQGYDGVRYAMYHWRVVYWLEKREVPLPNTVRRLCETERCVNPDHRGRR